jgi:predicted PurR-regulated permease PerM
VDQTSASRSSHADSRDDPEPRTPQLEELVESDAAPGAAWWRGALIGASALALALGFLYLVRLLVLPLTLLFAAIAIGEALSPVVDRLERRMPRTVAVIAVYVAFVLALAGLGWFMVPRLADQAQTLADNTPDLISRLERKLNEWDPGGGEQITSTIGDNLSRFSSLLIDLPVRIVSSVVQIVLVMFMSAYWLITGPRLGEFVRGLFPARTAAQVDEVIGELRQSVGGYVRGEILASIIIGSISYIGLSIIGVQYAIVLALIAFFGEFLPIIGPILSAIPALAIALIDSPSQALIVLVFYVLLQQFESNILLPQVMNQTAHIPPLLSIIALFAGGTVGGLLGALVAIPMAGALKVLITSVAAPAIRAWSGREHT